MIGSLAVVGLVMHVPFLAKGIRFVATSARFVTRGATLLSNRRENHIDITALLADIYISADERPV